MNNYFKEPFKFFGLTTVDLGSNTENDRDRTHCVEPRHSRPRGDGRTTLKGLIKESFDTRSPSNTPSRSCWTHRPVSFQSLGVAEEL
jgi:hypothetical protein